MKAGYLNMGKQGKTLRKFPIYLCLAFLLVGEVASAAIINGSFETGDFTGWETLLTRDDTRVVTSAFDDLDSYRFHPNPIYINPVSGKFQALLTTQFTWVYGTQQLDLFSGIPSGSLEYLAGLNNPSTIYHLPETGYIPVWTKIGGGSAIKQTFNANAGNVLSLHWNFLQTEGHPPGYDVAYLGDGNFVARPWNDFAYLSLSSPDVIFLQYLADCNSPASVYSEDPKPFFETGYQEFSFTIPVTGQYTLAIGVADLNDERGQSDLLIDKVRVPEPSTMLLLGLGLLGVLALKRNLRAQF